MKSYKLNIVLFEPEIPENTGNISRTCVGFNAKLHLIRPYGFFLNDKKYIRSSVNYQDKLILQEHDSIEEFLKSVPKNSNLFFISRYGLKTTDKIKFNFQKDTYLIFGKESTGLPKDILTKYKNNVYRIPTTDNIRSLNLSNCVAMLIYDYHKTNKFKKMHKFDPFKTILK